MFDEVVDGELSAEGMRGGGKTDVDATTEYLVRRRVRYVRRSPVDGVRSARSTSRVRHDVRL